MALTKAQEIALFQVLEVPYSPTKYTPTDRENMAMQVYTIQNSTYQAYGLITDFLTALDPDVETVLVEYLTCWIAIGTRTTAIVDGQVGAISGISSDPNLDRQEIQRQVKVIVPFYRIHKEIEHKADINISLPRIR